MIFTTFKTLIANIVRKKQKNGAIYEYACTKPIRSAMIPHIPNIMGWSMYIKSESVFPIFVKVLSLLILNNVTSRNRLIARNVVLR